MDERPSARKIQKPTSRGRLIGILVAVLALGGLVWLGWSLAHGSKAAGPGGFGGRGGRPSTTVGVATAKLGDIPIGLDALGTVTPAATVTVSPQVSGTITEILFREGQMVSRGQALAIIDQRPLQLALQQAQGALTRDQAQLTNARLLLDRDKTLLAQDSIARQDVDTQAALVRQLEGTVATDRAAVGTAQLNLGYSRVVSPVAGRVGLRVVDVGNYVAAGNATGLAVVTEVTPIDVVFTVPQDEVPRLQGRAARASLGVTALDRTRTLVLDQGTFSTLDNRVDTTTGTVKAKARFPNAQGTLFPNQFVNVRIGLDTVKDAVVVPVTAVRTSSSGQFVWVLKDGHTASMRKVTSGPATATQVSIVEGLKAGEVVVTEGGDRLTDGARVTLPGEKPQAPGAGGRHKRGGRHRPGGAQGGAAGADAQGAGGAQGGGQGRGGQRGGGQGGQGGGGGGGAG